MQISNILTNEETDTINEVVNTLISDLKALPLILSKLSNNPHAKIINLENEAISGLSSDATTDG